MITTVGKKTLLSLFLSPEHVKQTSSRARKQSTRQGRASEKVYSLARLFLSCRSAKTSRSLFFSFFFSLFLSLPPFRFFAFFLACVVYICSKFSVSRARTRRNRLNARSSGFPARGFLKNLFLRNDFSKTCFFRVENSLSLSLSLFRGGPCRSKMHPFINAPLYLWPKEKEGMQRRGMKKEFSVPALGDQRGAGGGGEN